MSNNDAARLAALDRLAILDSAPEAEFDDLVQLAAQLCDAPLALLAFIAADRQWFKARLGVETAEAPRGALCEAILRHDDIIVVPDALAHETFASDPLVAGSPNARFVAAAPVRAAEGHTLGALVVLDRAPRELGPQQQAALRGLGHQAGALLELRRRALAPDTEIAQVREREQLFRTIVETIPLSVLISSVADGTIRYANPAFAELLGHSVETLIGQRTPDFYYDPSERAQVIEQLRRDGKLSNYDLHIKTREGVPRWVLMAVQVMRYNEEPVLLAALHDVTERKQVEAALQNSQLLLQLVMNTMPQSICWKDRYSVYLGCNRQFARDVGLTDPAEIAGKTDYDLPSAEFADHYRADDRQVIESGIPKLNFEEPQPRADGTRSWLRTSKAPLSDSAGAIVGILVMYEDITGRKREEDERAQLKDDLIRAQAAALAELSTPLIPISDDTVVMPLIGTIDTRRAQQVIESLLVGIVETHTQVAILDITGVPVVDTQVANALVRAAQAVKLLGARVVLTGIRPEVAQTLVGLGVDLSGIVTRSTLQSGIAFALGRGGTETQSREAQRMQRPPRI
jgi:rsbT co-antagonist protein RsbR